MKKRLLKDLPFGNLEEGTVLYKVNAGYQVSQGETFYSTGGSSDNGIIQLSKVEKEIIDKIFDDSEWFEEATLKKVYLIPRRNSITLRFKSMDLDDAVAIAKGLKHIFPMLKDGSYIWNEFGDADIELSNN